MRSSTPTSRTRSRSQSGSTSREVDYQLEQARADRRRRLRRRCPDGVELVSLEGRREDLLEAVWPVALEGYADLPLPGEVSYTLEDVVAR